MNMIFVNIIQSQCKILMRLEFSYPSVSLFGRARYHVNDVCELYISDSILCENNFLNASCCH